MENWLEKKEKIIINNLNILKIIFTLQERQIVKFEDILLRPHISQADTIKYKFKV